MYYIREQDSTPRSMELAEKDVSVTEVSETILGREFYWKNVRNKKLKARKKKKILSFVRSISGESGWGGASLGGRADH